MAKAKDAITAGDIRRMLCAKYSGEAYARFHEVANGTGSNQSRAVDMVIQSLWPSNGLWRGAYEIKVARSDFIKETQDPEKFAWAIRDFHYMWYVAPVGVINPGEVPEAAGWLAPVGGKLTIKKPAPQRDNPGMPAALFASLCRSACRVSEGMKAEEVQAAIAKDPQVKRLQAIEDGLELFFQRRGGHVQYYDGWTAQRVCADIEKRIGDKLQSPEEHKTAVVAKALEDFRDKMNGAVTIMAALAATSLDAADEAGRLVFDQYGYGVAKARAKERKWREEENQEANAIAEAILSMRIKG